MKKTFLAVAMAVLIASTGCNSGTTGGSGKDKEKGKDSRTTGEKIKDTVVQPEGTFKLTVPTLSTGIKQGETKPITIGISRGKNFDEDVSVKFENLPEGVTIEPASPTIKKSDKEVKVDVKASDTAALGKATVKMIGHPSKGDDATHDLTINVSKK